MTSTVRQQQSVATCKEIDEYEDDDDDDIDYDERCSIKPVQCQLWPSPNWLVVAVPAEKTKSVILISY